MKVLQIANGYFESSLYNSLFEALNSLEIHNTVYVPIKRDYRKTVIEIPHKKIEYNLILDKCFSSIDRLVYYSKQRNILNGITKRVNIGDYQIIHAHTLFSAGYSAMQIKRKYSIPYVTAVRNVDLNVFFKKMFHLRKEGVKILREADKVVFLSSVYRDAVIDNYVPKQFKEEILGKSLVIPNGINSIFLESVPNKKRNVSKEVKLIYAGDIDNNKNLSLTVDACKLLISEGYNCTFNIVGEILEMPYNSFLNERFINHFPRCSQEELIKYYRANDIFVMPSHTETFGMVYAEAMSQGLPIIYTRGQGFDGQYEEGKVGFSVSDKDANELANNIKQILGNYEYISDNCIRYSKKYSWRKIAENYRKVYREVSRKYE